MLLTDKATGREGYGFGSFTVQLFDLANPVTYGDGERHPLVDGYALVGEGSILRDVSDPNETLWLELIFDADAGMQYSLVSELSLEVGDDAWLDLFGTASLDRIEIGDGQQLTFASGTRYNVVGPSVDPIPAGARAGDAAARRCGAARAGSDARTAPPRDLAAERLGSVRQMKARKTRVVHSPAI